MIFIGYLIIYFIFCFVLVVAGSYTYYKLTSIRWFSRFLQFKCEGGLKDLIFIKMKVRNILPHWAYGFGGGPAPTWTWRIALFLALLSPSWVLSWMGFQFDHVYMEAFVLGFVLEEIDADRRHRRWVEKFIDDVEREHHILENFSNALIQAQKEEGPH
jgi:hypothetical protein